MQQPEGAIPARPKRRHASTIRRLLDLLCGRVVVAFAGRPVDDTPARQAAASTTVRHVDPVRSPRISIIVPALEEASTLATLVSVLDARDDIDEIVIVDASRDEESAAFYVKAASARASRLRCVGALGVGRAVQMNLGAETSDADWLVFLHADSRLPGVNLRELLGVAAPVPGWGRFDVRLDSDRWWARVISGAMNARSRMTGIATGDQAMFIHRELFVRCGGFRDMPLMEDIEMSGRLKQLARPACLRARVTTSARRWRRDGVIRTIWLMWRLRLLFWLGADSHRLARMYRHAR